MRILPIGGETSIIRKEYHLGYSCFLSESFEVFLLERKDSNENKRFYTG